MTDRSAPFSKAARLAAVLAAAGFFFVAPALAQTRLPPPPASVGGADARQDRIQELEEALRDAEARGDDLQRQLNEANREITRLRGMVGELAGVNQSLSTPPPESGAPNGQPGPGGEAASTGLNDAQRRATGTLGQAPANAAPAAPQDAAAAYTRARELLVNGNYAEAEEAFGRFLEQHPNAEQAADARYWFASTLLARNNYQDAAANFVQYLQRTPQGPRGPEAQVGLGMALVGMGQRQQGCAAFASLTRRYPNAPRHVRDRAAGEARAAQCA